MIFSKLFFLIALVSILTTSRILAQSNVRFEHFGAEQGLSQHAVNCMIADKNGFIWVGTQDGLNRYDGYHFTVYRNDPSSEKSISSKWILSLAEGADGIIWVGTQKGVNHLNSFTMEAERYVYSPDDTNSISSDEAKCLLVDHTGLIWIGTSDGLNVLDYKTKKIGRFFHQQNDNNSISDNNILCLSEDKKGTVWVGTINGLSYFDRKTSKFISLINELGNSITFISEDQESRLWIGIADKGLFEFDRVQRKFIRYEHRDSDKNISGINDITGILEDKPGNLWMATRAGLLIFNEKSFQFSRFHSVLGNPKSLHSDNLSNICKDREGNIWIGSSDGFDKYNPRVSFFNHYFHNPYNENSLSHDQVWPIVEDEDGILWAGIFGGGLNRFDRVNNKWTHFNHNPGDANSLRDDTVSYLSNGRNGKLWVAPVRGLDCLDKKTGKFNHYYHNDSDSASINPISAGLPMVFEDRGGNLWASTDKGLDKLNTKTGKFQHYSYNEKDSTSISSNAICGIIEREDGKLWIATFDNGINLFDPPTNNFKRYVHQQPNGLSDQIIYCIHEDRNGNIWTGGSAGIDKLDPVNRIAIHYSQKNGLPNETVYRIEEDNNGKLWISTNQGITMLDPATNQFKYFDISDGLQDLEFNGYSSTKSKRTGEIFFGGVRGFNSFYADSFADNSYKPTVIITSLRRYSESKSGLPLEEKMMDKKAMTFSYWDNMLGFEFMSLSLSNPEKNQYAYQLKGFNDEWHQLGTKREVTFTGLTPGHYTLLVKGSNSSGVWNDTPAELSITILPPWWKTWWAYALYVMVFIAALFSFIWYRSKNLKEQNIKLEHKVEVRTNELRKSLEELKATQQQLIQSEKMASLGELTAGIAHEIQNPLNFVNNFSEVNSELIAEMKNGIDRGNLDEIRSIAQDIDDNEQKIIFHGKRADAIVKSMLQHSRTSSRQKESTDVNALADEYLRLAYHGLRAKDKSFNAQFDTEFDTSIGKINIVPQEIGRVLLNLINNAFYAVNEKAKPGAPNYEPRVIVSTKKLDGTVEISVADNGNGIPKNIVDKVFQPFFTTKPTGQGTGLGLSLAYDIVKAHGGDIKVETEEGEGSEFTIYLPS